MHAVRRPRSGIISKHKSGSPTTKNECLDSDPWQTLVRFQNIVLQNRIHAIHFRKNLVDLSEQRENPSAGTRHSAASRPRSAEIRSAPRREPSSRRPLKRAGRLSRFCGGGTRGKEGLSGGFGPRCLEENSSYQCLVPTSACPAD